MIEEAVTRLADGPLTHWGDLDQALAAHHFRPGSVGFVKAVPQLA